ncbi:MAG: multiprotein-bridging factor 1 family protein, partial [Archaeoglobaceae archaeon]
MGRESIRTSINPEVLKWARETAGWTIEEVSQKLGVKPETYQKIESGEKHPTLNVLKK